MNHRHAIAAALIGLAAAFGASAQDAASPAAKGYDYASKFYPHPAWLYLSSEAPRERSDHPAVIVARRAKAEADAAARGEGSYDYAAKFYPHPAWMHLLPEAPHEMSEHPAVIVARNARAAEREAARVELAASFAPHN